MLTWNRNHASTAPGGPPLLFIAMPFITVLFAHCTPSVYNAGDPTSMEHMQTQLLRCALADQAVCPIAGADPAAVVGEERRPLIIAPSNGHMCALNHEGRVRCWGQNNNGQLGYGNTTQVGDGVGPTIEQAGDVPIGGTVTQIAAGTAHTCALLDTGAVRCWGANGSGQLGYNNTTIVGNGIGPSIIAAGDVPLGGTAVQIAAGSSNTCALLDTGNVRCWGPNGQGQLGHNNTTAVGDGVGTTIIAAGDVPVGGTVTRVDVGDNFACALLDTGAVRCWGNGAQGRMGHGNTTNVGNGIGPSILAAGDLPLGSTAVGLEVGNTHACVLLPDDNVRCWGDGADGKNGSNSTTDIGDGAGPSITAAGNVSIGAMTAELSVGATFSCVRTTSDGVRCWGQNGNGRLGTGAAANVGDGVGPTIIAQGDMNLGDVPIRVFAGYRSACATISETEARCWGRNGNGELGIGGIANIGDDELPSAGPVTVIF